MSESHSVLVLRDLSFALAEQIKLRVCVCFSVCFTFRLYPLTVAHQTVLEIRSAADDGVTADHTALDVTPGTHTHTHVNTTLTEHRQSSFFS